MRHCFVVGTPAALHVHPEGYDEVISTQTAAGFVHAVGESRSAATRKTAQPSAQETRKAPVCTRRGFLHGSPGVLHLCFIEGQRGHGGGRSIHERRAERGTASVSRLCRGAAMDAGKLERQVASVERGIAFLKQEHLAMLTGLQLEITHLRRRCHELTCELDSRFPDRSTEEEEAELAARCEAAQRLLQEQQCMMVATRGELRAGRARASALGRSLREEERHFLEELKRRSHKITLLSRELHRQNVTTTTLCHELHTARLKLYQQQRGTESGAEGEEEPRTTEEGEEDRDDEGDECEEDEDYEEEGSDWLLSPPPPASPSQREARHKRRVREDRVRACVPQERVTSPQRPQPMPDPAVFLVPLRYRLLRLSQPIRTQHGEGMEDEWEDIEDSRVHRRVDMGAGEGETAL
ncbi:uncharacterized protein LOC120821789 [Gasterosteus aculeatus]